MKTPWPNGLGFDLEIDGEHFEVMDDPVQSVIRLRSETCYLELPRTFKVLGVEIAQEIPPAATLARLVRQYGEPLED